MVLPAAILVPPVLYILVSIITSVIPVGESVGCSARCVTVYVFTDYFHTDIVLPANSGVKWMERLAVNASISGAGPDYLAFGFGDLDFYVNTPTRADFKLETALRALFLPTPAVIHVTPLFGRPALNKTTVAIQIDEKRMRSLNESILSSFRTDPGGSFIPVCCSYERGNDAFYEAKESFHLFRTCNTWVGSVLKRAGVKNALWTPYGRGVFWHLREKI